MSRLIQIDPEAKLQPEQEAYEFGYHAFEDMEPIEYEADVVDSTSSKDPIPLPGEELKLPLEDEKLKELQQKDKFCREVVEKLTKNNYKGVNLIIKKEEYSKGLWSMANKNLKQ